MTKKIDESVSRKVIEVDGELATRILSCCHEGEMEILNRWCLLVLDRMTVCEEDAIKIADGEIPPTESMADSLLAFSSILLIGAKRLAPMLTRIAQHFPEIKEVS